MPKEGGAVMKKRYYVKVGMEEKKKYFWGVLVGK
jgi:hypothetical protein